MLLAEDNTNKVTEYRFRGAERVSARIDGTVTRAGAPRLDVCVRNISSLGFSAECTDFISIGSLIELEIPGQKPLSAEVRWALAGWIGCRFHEELAKGTLNQLLPCSG